MDITKPEEVGISPQKLRQVTETLQSQIDEDRLVGMVAMAARGDKLFYLEPFGFMDREHQKPMARDTIFRLKSLTKPITAAAVMILFDEGKLHLHVPIHEFIPAFKDVKVYDETLGRVALQKPITAHDLLTHTAGLTYGLLDVSPVDEIVSAAGLTDPSLFHSTAPLAEIVTTLASFPLAFQPGSAWRYSYANDVLARLVEVVAQQPFDQFLSERIFQPLAMEDTGFFVPSEKWERLATLYTKSEEGEWVSIERAGEGRYSHAHPYISGGSGLVGTAADYMRFCQMLQNRGTYAGQRLLSQKAVELMTKNGSLGIQGVHPDVGVM